MLFEYIRLINEAKPRFFVFENVKGLTNAALKHMPFYERIKKERGEIDKESQLGSAFKYVLELLADTGYTIKYKILNAADFGTPQKEAESNNNR